MQIKLLQWNILYTEKIENVVKQIKELKPDVVCLQELGVNCKYNPSVPNTAYYIKGQLGYNAFFEEAQRWEEYEEFGAIGNGIFTRFPITKTSAKYVQNQAKVFTDHSHEGRVYVEVDLQVDGKTLTVGTAHLSYVYRFEITEEKRREVDNLLQIIKNKKKQFVFAGDLNSTPTSYATTELSKHLQNCSPSYDQNTWTTKPFDYQGFKEDKLNWRLDYIFATKDVRCLSSKVVKTDYSDHLPVVANLSI